MKHLLKIVALAIIFVAEGVCTLSAQQQKAENYGRRAASEFDVLKGKKILYVERNQYPPDHHNTGTIFQFCEINQDSFSPNSYLKVYDVDSGQITTLLHCQDGVIRDPELSWDGTNIVFSMRTSKEGSYNIYRIDVDGGNLKQLTADLSSSDLDPVYLPSGEIVFSSTRQPKYCMCNRHIMANLHKMQADGANIEQIGVSTLFEGHPTVLDDGRILYDRWEYVDRNFGDAQGLWVVNPDGTKHAIYYGNNTNSPGGVIDARQIPGTDLVVSIFSSCHDRPWGALAVLDRKLGVDGEPAVIDIMPKNSRKLIGVGNWDTFRNKLEYRVEDPWPIDRYNFLVSGNSKKINGHRDNNTSSGIFMMNLQGDTRDLIIEAEVDGLSVFDPMIIEARALPKSIPNMRNYTSTEGTFYVQNVYEGTHMEGVEPGSVKYLRVVETPEKRSWTVANWQGQGAQAPGVNWHSLEVKRVIGEVEVEADGSAHFTAPSGVFLFFQLLDKDRKMIQSMRSGVSLMPGEINGCIGCHEDRLSAPISAGARGVALRRKAETPRLVETTPGANFSYMENVQPILDRNCVSCHDFDIDKPEKLVLASDRNMFFNASYINMHVGEVVNLVGGGPANIMQAYSWGTYPSKLTQIIEQGHHDVKLTLEEREMLYLWMDLNGVYYPTYESSFDENMAGRSPLTPDEVEELAELTGLDFNTNLRFSSRRKAFAQISFERAELSPALYAIRSDKAKYDRALEIIKTGAERLAQTPRGDIESDIVVHPRLKQQLNNYAEWLEQETKKSQIRKESGVYYDAGIQK